MTTDGYAATFRCQTCGKVVTSDAVWDGVHVVPDHDPECNGNPSRCDNLCPIPVPCGPAVEVEGA